MLWHTIGLTKKVIFGVPNVDFKVDIFGLKSGFKVDLC